jgi:hypothetical protein
MDGGVASFISTSPSSRPELDDDEEKEEEDDDDDDEEEDVVEDAAEEGIWVNVESKTMVSQTGHVLYRNVLRAPSMLCSSTGSLGMVRMKFILPNLTGRVFTGEVCCRMASTMDNCFGLKSTLAQIEMTTTHNVARLASNSVIFAISSLLNFFLISSSEKKSIFSNRFFLTNSWWRCSFERSLQSKYSIKNAPFCWRFKKYSLKATDQAPRR